MQMHMCASCVDVSVNNMLTHTHTHTSTRTNHATAYDVVSKSNRYFLERASTAYQSCLCGPRRRATCGWIKRSQFAQTGSLPTDTHTHTIVHGQKHTHTRNGAPDITVVDFTHSICWSTSVWPYLRVAPSICTRIVYLQNEKRGND